jgi:hypothetical protein
MAKVNKREHLLKVCRILIDNPECVDADAVTTFRKAVLQYADLQHLDREQALKNLYQSESEVGVMLRKAFAVIDDAETRKRRDDQNFRSTATGAVYPKGDRFLDEVADPDDIDEREADDDNDDDDIGKADHHASTVADLLVESGSFPHRAAALHHLLRKPGGQALLARLKAAEQTKESNMRTTETVESVLKDLGPVRLCEGICARQRAPCDERELVAVLTKHLGDDRAFAKLYEAEESVRRACSIAKAAEFEPYDIKPIVVGGADVDPNDPSAAVRAREEIERLGREKYPFLNSNQQFARIFEDKNYAALAARVHQRPAPTTIYQGPGSADPGRGAYTKSDPVPSADSAYSELMAKAEAYREAHPELSISQSFAAVYSDRSNIELAKRERVESAPR